MKTQVIVKFSSSSFNPRWEVQLHIDRLRRKLKSNIVKTINGNHYYKFDLEDVLYQEILKLKKKYDEDIVMTIEFEPSYSDVDLEKAVAFIPQFKKICMEEYGDDNLTHIQICDECGISILKEKLIANPDGKGKILKSSAAVIKCGEQIDELYGISKYMYDQIDDINFKENFKPIFAKKSKEPFGYAFSATEIIDLYNKNYVYEICDNCGKTYAEEKNL